MKALCVALCLLLAPLPHAAAKDKAAKTAVVPAKVPVVSDTVATARTEIWQDLNAGAIGSAAVAIMDNGKMVYSEGFGMADRVSGIPVDQNTLFNIGSVSKVYTAVAIMLLVDAGKVELDKPVTAYLPDFVMADDRYKDITVRMTLNHTSGLPGTTGENNFGFAFNEDVYKDTLAALARSQLKHRPGERAIYSNDGFTLAEMIVVRVSGQPFTDFLNDRLFRPLGLQYTGSSVGQWPAAPGLTAAKFYPPDKTGSEPLEIISVIGAGGMAASAEDLCRFADLFSGKSAPLLSPQALEELRRIQPSATAGQLRSPDISWGLGWDVTDLPLYKGQNIKILGKGGNSGTYTAQLFTAPDHRISVAIVSTGRAGSAPRIADKVLTSYLAGKGLMKQPAGQPDRPVKAQPIPAELKAFEGYYTDGKSVARLSLDLAQGTLTSYRMEGAAETPVFSAVYHDGYFYRNGSLKGPKFYFTAQADKRYFVVHVAPFGGDGIDTEKIEPVTAPAQLVVPIDGQRWLRRNVKPYEGSMSLADHMTVSSLIPALPGYIQFDGIKKVQSPLFASMAIGSSRDLTELRLVARGGRMWAWSGGSLYMPADLVPTMTAGTTTGRIESDGYNQWLKVSEDSLLTFAAPAGGRIVLLGADGRVLYDSVMDKGAVFAPAGSYVEMAGKPIDVFTVTAKAVE